MKALKKIEIVMEIIVLLLVLWLAVSFCNVLLNNTYPCPVYPAWNVFHMILG